MTCSRCGSDNPSGKKFCGQCGAPGESVPEVSRRQSAEQQVLRRMRRVTPRHPHQRSAHTDIVRRILASHYRPEQRSGDPSWLTFIGHLKDSLWSIDLFRCESATLRTHWILVVMDQYTRRILGFGVHAEVVDGIALCRMFNQAIRGHRAMPKYLSSDHDPLYRFKQWQANLRILEVTEIKTVPYVPLSHPFVERLIGTVRREYLDRTLFWTTVDLETKLLEFRDYFNSHRTHHSLEGQTPDRREPRPVANLTSYRWQRHCRGLYQTPIAA